MGKLLLHYPRRDPLLIFLGKLQSFLEAVVCGAVGFYCVILRGVYTVIFCLPKNKIRENL